MRAEISSKAHYSFAAASAISFGTLEAVRSLTVENLATATALWVAFVGGLVRLRKLVPGPLRQGQLLRDGTRKTYKLNAFYILLLCAARCPGGRAGDAPVLAGERASAVLAAVRRRQRARGRCRRCGCSCAGGAHDRARGLAVGSVVHDLWFGAELNPELWGVDLKMFAYVPSLIGLCVLNLSFAVAQWEELGHLTTRMMLYQAFFTIYVFNYFQFEYGMLHTWDVIAENFGFMLVWGDAPFVPFFYSIGGWYVLRNHGADAVRTRRRRCASCSSSGCGCSAASNEQKHRYKEDPTAPIWGKHARDRRWQAARVRVLGHRPQAQLHRRADGLLRVDAVHRVRVDRAVPAAAVAGVPVLAPRLARRAALPRQVRRAVGRVLPARALPHDPVRVLMTTPKLLTVGDYRRAARAKLSPMAWRYFRSGADARGDAAREPCARCGAGRSGRACSSTSASAIVSTTHPRRADVDAGDDRADRVSQAGACRRRARRRRARRRRRT